MEEGKDHEAEGRGLRPPGGKEGRAQVARGAVAHENEGQHDLVGRQPQQKAGEDGPVQAEESAHGVQKADEGGEQGGPAEGQMAQKVDDEPAGGRHGHRPKEDAQGPVEEGADDDLPHLGPAKGGQLQGVGRRLPLEHRSGQEKGQAQGHQQGEGDEAHHEPRAQQAAAEEHRAQGQQGREPAVAGSDAVGEDGDEPLPPGVDDPAARDPHGVAPEAHAHRQGLLAAGVTPGEAPIEVEGHPGQVPQVITMLDESVIRAQRLSGQKWYEIDDIQDLDIAESIFTPDDDERVLLLQHRFGGFWRYPKLLDFCYLVNPYFPSKRMKDELRANFDTLLTEYPSGMRVNSLLAAKNFGVHQENILVGNGAAELIKCLMESFEGTVGFIRPTFEEYPNRYDRLHSIDFVPDNKDFSYTADDVMEFFGDKDIQSLIIINPDNPSGNYIAKPDLLRLIDWSREKGIKLVIDESFVDFADAEDSTLFEQDIIAANPHLFVMKSISKSYGVPGLRLGVLASGDVDCIAKMKKDVAIWNINSFGEFYMQIEEKYKKDYKEALKVIRAERVRFQHKLSQVKGIRVIPSQANYVMVEVEQGISPKDLLKILLVKYNILVKELTTKTNGRNYLRLAVRTTEDNDKLIEAMKEVLGEA